MIMTNQNNNGTNNNGGAKKEKQIPAVMFNTLGISPTEVEFSVKTSELREYIKTFASTRLDGVYDVSIFATKTKREDDERKAPKVVPVCYLWLKNDSDDLVDKTAKAGDTIIFDNLPNPSNRFKSFANAYAVDDYKSLKFIKTDDDRNVKGIMIDLLVILSEIFDTRNKEFKTQYPHVKHVPDWNIEVRAVAGEKDTIDCLKVRKYRNNKGKQRHSDQLTPKRSARF